MWKNNGQKVQEAKCARRFLMLFISHFVEHCESLPEIPKDKLRGRSKRTYAYEIASRETGEKVKDLRLMASWSRKYLAIATGAGLSRFLEISYDKSWFWEKKMNEADIHLACRSLRDQHGKMTEKEKKLRSSLDFQTAQHIMITLGRLGLAKEKLVEMNTGLTKVLGEFLDLESIRHGQIKQNNQNFYHRIENPRNATGEHVAQASSTDEHNLPTNAEESDYSAHTAALSADNNNNNNSSTPDELRFNPATRSPGRLIDNDYMQSGHTLEDEDAGSDFHGQHDAFRRDMAAGCTQNCATADSSSPQVPAYSRDNTESNTLPADYHDSDAAVGSALPAPYSDPLMIPPPREEPQQLYRLPPQRNAVAHCSPSLQILLQYLPDLTIPFASDAEKIPRARRSSPRRPPRGRVEHSVDFCFALHLEHHRVGYGFTVILLPSLAKEMRQEDHQEESKEESQEDRQDYEELGSREEED
ncbi:hypothetical protein GTA08_BOTSDO13083 [Botryosphaeria dothidea]|uniref:Uncharacterized protein n=1 Tax=Botryosphaeria dothidea TaxID=55169 RepID=A0A8H4J1P5_9PEZI|nr:hypothetical protein GTA08_BOTSDO13083 [Botryosphaeria dothidea]